jgi:putative redox protein
MDASVTWKGKMSFEGTANSGFVLPLDTKVEQGGDGNGFSPMELILVGLAGCTGMDVIDILHKKRQDVTGFEVRVHGDRASEYPKVFDHIVVEYIITGHNVNPAAVDRSVELSFTKYCPVQAMVALSAQIEHKITILEVA